MYKKIGSPVDQIVNLMEVADFQESGKLEASQFFGFYFNVNEMD